MQIGTVVRATAVAVLFPVAGALIVSAARPAFVPASHSTSGVTGSTMLSGGAGCSCHGGGDGGLTVTIYGPATLAAGERGTYFLTTSGPAVPSARVGFNIASSSGPGSLALEPGEPTLIQAGELTHSGAARTFESGSVTYKFAYQMPLFSDDGASHTIAAVSSVGFSSGWKHAADFVVVTGTPVPSPAFIGVVNQTAQTVQLSWAGSTLEYRVLRKTGSDQGFLHAMDPDATLVYEGPGNDATAEGLAPLTPYTFAVYGKQVAAASYSAGNQTVSVTTSREPRDFFVDVSAGSDLNAGTFEAPFKTVTRGLSHAVDRDTVQVAAGRYDLDAGEIFPLVVQSGVRLIGAAAATTILDATGADRRVLESHSGNTRTMVTGFTITGGFVTGPEDPQVGGGIYLGPQDQSTIAGNVIVGNRVQAGAQTEISEPGKSAYGGGIYVAGASRVINNIIERNEALGGKGGANGEGPLFPVSGGAPIRSLGHAIAGPGGDGAGGGLYVSGAAVLMNNTIVRNAAAGGAGGNREETGEGDGYADGGAAYGGGAWGGSHVNTIFAANTATGGPPSEPGTAADGDAFAGGLYGGTASYCLFFDNAPLTGETLGLHAILADPRFLDSSSGDYHPIISSPATAAGTSENAPDVDLDGVVRPTPPTIGALESVLAPTTVTLQSSLNPSILDSAVTFTATVAAQGGWPVTGSITFKDGLETLGSRTLSSGTATYTSSSLDAGEHEIAAVYDGDSNNLGSLDAVTQVVNFPPFGPPPNFSARGVTSTEVSIAWTPVAGATSYQLQRAEVDGSFITIATPTGDSFSDGGVVANRAYLYRVRAVGNSVSSYTPVDPATTVMFVDEPLAAGTVAKTIHVAQLRTAVAALRFAADLPPFAFSDSTLLAQTTPIRALHLQQLRTALDQARSALNLQPLVYTDPTLGGSTRIKATHQNEIRAGVQ